jgi:YtkA-like protein
MTMRLTLLAAIAAVLALPASAGAGGWATVGLEPPLDGTPAGEVWEAELTILQHGRTPLDGVNPRVLVRRDGVADAKERVFAAKPTGEPGVYRASVTFDAPGTWRYRVDDGFSAYHSFKPVRIAAGGKKAPGEAVAVANTAAAAPPSGGATGGDDGPDYLLAILGAVVAALVAGGGAALVQRWRGGAGPAAG